jgi:hypothetical protein
MTRLVWNHLVTARAVNAALPQFGEFNLSELYKIPWLQGCGQAVRAAFEKMFATGTSAHHAEHVLAEMLLETAWERSRSVKAGNDVKKVQTVYNRKLQKLIGDSAFRKKLTRQFTADHSAFE